MINLALGGRTWENVAWGKTNVTANDNEVAGPDGRTRAASLTATAANGTVIQDLGVIGSAAKVWGPWIKRKTGVGDIELTLNNGGAWTAITVTADWTRVEITATLADPDIGIRIVTDTDAIYVDYAQAEASTFLASTTPETVASAITVNADVLTYASAGNIIDRGTVFAEYTPISVSVGDIVNKEIIRMTGGTGGNLFLRHVSSNNLRGQIGTTPEGVTGLVAGVPAKTAIVFNGTVASITTYLDGTASAEGTQAAVDTGWANIAIGTNVGGTAQTDGTIRFVQIYSRELNSSQVGAL